MQSSLEYSINLSELSDWYLKKKFELHNRMGFELWIIAYDAILQQVSIAFVRV